MLTQLAHFGRAFRLVWRVSPREAAFTLVGLALQGAMPALLILAARAVVDLAATAARSGTIVVADAAPAVSLWVAALLLDSALSPWLAATQGNLTEKLTADVNVRLMRKADSLPDLSRFESPAFYNELQLLREQAIYQPINLLVFGTNAVRELIVIASVLSVLASLALWLPALLLAAAAPHAVALFKLQRSSWETMVARSPEARRMQYLSSLALSDTHAKEARLHGFVPWITEQYRTAFASTHLAMRSVRLRQAGWSSALVAVSVLAAALAFGWAVTRAVAGAISPGGILLVVQSLHYLQRNMLAFAEDVTMLQETGQYFSTLFGFLDSESPMPTAASTRPVPIVSTEGIRLNDVTFSYPDGRRALLGVNMTLRPGSVTALVGENGAGKTTVAKLLVRFYDPQAGSVTVEGEDLRKLDLRAWRDATGAVMQDFGRYQFTLEENIVLGPSSLDVHSPETADILTSSGLTDLVERLPAGLKEPLGKQFGGTELSGGEWQRVAIARALARRTTARLLILDEPTSSLDPRHEHELYYRFASMARGITTLLITHRLASVRMADQIYVLHGGRVVEQGDHEQLLEQGGHYAALWSMQAEAYKG